MVLTNSTITGNAGHSTSGGTRGGGIWIISGTVGGTNTIIANNPTGGDCDGAIISLGHNLDSDGTCGLSADGDISEEDPLLESLRDNGGPTFTHALRERSPAIDAGDDLSAAAADQRGVARPQGAASDIGAYESQLTAAPTPTPTPPAPTPTATLTAVPSTLLFEATLKDGDYGVGQAINTFPPDHGGSPEVLGIVDSSDGVTFTSTEASGRSNALINWEVGVNAALRSSGTISVCFMADGATHVSGEMVGENYGFNQFRNGQATFGTTAGRLGNGPGLEDDQVIIGFNSWHNNI